MFSAVLCITVVMVVRSRFLSCWFFFGFFLISLFVCTCFFDIDASIHFMVVVVQFCAVFSLTVMHLTVSISAVD